MRLLLTMAALVALCATSVGAVTYRVVYYMQAYNQPGGLIEGSPGTFYSEAGGPDCEIFSVTSAGSISYLATFNPNIETVDGAPVSAANGLFYSSVQYTGGSISTNVISVSSSPGSLQTYPTGTDVIMMAQNLPDGTLLGWNPGQLLKSDLGGIVTLLYSFPSGGYPYAPVYATDGNYYVAVGLYPDASGYAYKLTPKGSLTSLYNFPAGSFNGSLFAALVEGSDGNLYGTTPTGGSSQSGTIYKLTRSGGYTLLYTFPNSPAGIAGPLIEGSDGKLYGATSPYSGSSLLYRITKSGHYEVIYRMLNQTQDGQCPCSLVQGSDGMIYGTAIAGGATGAGLIFALDAGLPKPKPRALQFTPRSGSVGTQVQIWGYNLFSASVQFNGVPATGVSNSGPNYLLATVPAGVTTGPITITTPGGTTATRTSFHIN